MDAYQSAILIVWLTLSPYTIFGYLFYQNRHLYPIKGRFPRVSLGESFSVWLTGATHCFYILFHYDCQVYEWLQFFQSCVFQGAFNYRLVQLLFNYEITQNISELKDQKKFKEWTPNWFISHRWLAQDKFILRTSITMLFVYLLILLIYSLTVPDICALVAGNFSPWNAMWSLKAVIGVVFSIIIAIKMRKYPPDAFGLKNEFKLRVFFPIILILFFQVLPYADSRIDPGPMIPLGIVVICHPLLFFAIVHPYIQSVQQLEKARRCKGLAELGTLANWLNRPEGIRFFLAYLKREFSSENLLFYLDVVYYKTLPRNDIPTLKDQIDQIFRKFLDVQSPGAINISYEVNEYTSHQIQQVLNASAEEIGKMSDEELMGIFDRAQSEVYTLMSSDSFGRFQRTSEYERVKDIIGGSSDEKESKRELDELLGSPSEALDVVSAIRVDEDLERSALERSSVPVVLSRGSSKEYISNSRSMSPSMGPMDSPKVSPSILPMDSPKVSPSILPMESPKLSIIDLSVEPRESK